MYEVAPCATLLREPPMFIACLLETLEGTGGNVRSCFPSPVGEPTLCGTPCPNSLAIACALADG